MQIRLLLVAFIACVGLFRQSLAGCSCSCSNQEPPGVDYCRKGPCQTNIPRPKPIEHSKGLSKLLGPIGDTCSCGHAIVQPAIPPKPPCPLESLNPPSRQQLPCREKVVRAPEAFQGSGVNPNTVYNTHSGGTNNPEHRTLPADAVSLSLAYQLARNLRRPVPEAKIQYGFRKKPIIAITSSKGHYPDVPEEKLWSMDRAVIELKTPKAPAPIEEEDHEEEEEEEENIEHAARSPGFLTYGDIGFCPEKFKNKLFRSPMPREQITDHFCVDKAPHISGGSCGFRSGRVTVDYNSEPKVQRGLEDYLGDI